jgi:hypothetical protein
MFTSVNSPAAGLPHDHVGADYAPNADIAHGEPFYARYVSSDDEDSGTAAVVTHLSCPVISVRIRRLIYIIRQCLGSSR